MDTTLYREEQTAVPLLFMPLIALVIICIAAFAVYVFMVTEEFDIGSIDGIALLAAVIFAMALLVFLLTAKMKVTVTYDSLDVGFSFAGRRITTSDTIGTEDMLFGFMKGRVVPTGNIQNVSQEEFRTVKHLAGRGTRTRKKDIEQIFGSARKGLRIHLRTGRSIFVCSKNPHEFENAMREALRSIKK